MLPPLLQAAGDAIGASVSEAAKGPFDTSGQHYHTSSLGDRRLKPRETGPSGEIRHENHYEHEAIRLGV